MVKEKKEPWFKEGLRFKCTECGGCCTGSPGVVWVTQAEIKRLAERLEISSGEFTRKYTHKIDGRVSLQEDPTNYDCVFLEGKRCTVYTDRPKQCRTFPWWSDNLHSPQHWEEAAMRCEGINHPEAPLISLGEIQHKMQ